MTEDPLIWLVYYSSARKEFSREDLLKMLEKSRVKNARLGVTGMLLYRDGGVVQVLEGPQSVVRALYRTIERDERHGGVLKVLEEKTAQRVFPDWAMAFRDLKAEPEKEASFDDLFNHPPEKRKLDIPRSKVRTLLESFAMDAR